MSEYSAKLLRARTQQRRLYLALAAMVSSIFIVLLIVFVLLKVTSVVVLPDDAHEAAQIEVQQGIGFVVGRKVYGFGSELVLGIAAEGFASKSVAVKPDHSGSITVELEALPATLLATTNAGHEEIRWIVDGRLVAVDGELEITLQSGNYILSVDSPYHERKDVQVVLQRGEEKRLSIELLPVIGHINIDTLPSGMPVKIDGVLKGQTPLMGEYPGGKYVIEIAADEYETINEAITITSSSPEASRNYRLQLKKAYIDFDVTPAGGDLLVNGRKVDPGKPVGVSASVANTITYMKAGYYSVTRTLTLATGEKTKLALRLRAEMGQVEIRSNPADANVSIDGKIRGKTPLNLSLLAVKQQVTLSRKGYRSVTKSLLPSGIKSTLLNVTMRDEQSAKLAEAKKTYRNSIGMEFKLFTPSAFTMGAARHEKGQRANEFLREIDLRKPFYAGLKEVTVNQYSKFKKNAVSASSGNYPITTISWLDAAAFCNWISKREKLKPFYIIRNGQLAGIDRASDGYRLLSEAEWEWLARKAGRKQQTIFTWGNEYVVPPASGNIADESARNAVNIFVANYNDGYEQLAPVGSFPPDRAGLFDITGNASEWVHDYYSLLPPAKKIVEIDPLGDDTGTNHVIKGSSWRSGTLTELRASFRDGAVDGRQDTGFRVARYLYGGE